MKFEVKKLVCKRIVYVIVVLSMLINGIYCFNSADKINSKKYKNASECQKNIYKKIEGNITQDKADFISTEYERLKKNNRKRWLFKRIWWDYIFGIYISWL